MFSLVLGFYVLALRASYLYYIRLSATTGIHEVLGVFSARVIYIHECVYFSLQMYIYEWN